MHHRGFTILELLVVVAIVATLAGGIFLSVGDTQRNAERSVTQRELISLRRALLAFEADTGYLPNRRFLDPMDGDTLVRTPDLDSFPRFTAWYTHPANLTPLFLREFHYPEQNVEEEEPVLSLPEFDPDTGRGWRGPYLNGVTVNFVVAGDLQPNGYFDRQRGPALQPFHAVSDPHLQAAIDYFYWTSPAQTYLPFKLPMLDEEDAPPRVSGGAPFLFVELEGLDYVVSAGPNLRFNPEDPTDDDNLLLPLR